MKDITIINYQGSKSNLLDFISESIKNYVDIGDGVLDLFSGSAIVSNMLKSKYKVVSNDSEAYASMIASSILQPPVFDQKETFDSFHTFYQEHYKELAIKLETFLSSESELIQASDSKQLKELYNKLPSVWNTLDKNITPTMLRVENNFNLFSYYYAGTYFSLSQAMQIDSAIYAISKMDSTLKATLYSCLFYAIKEIVFSKDGHMAQPLSIDKYPLRHITQRQKSLLPFFRKKLLEFSELEHYRVNENEVYNMDFWELLSTEKLAGKISLIYADPPYTDMQYSRYYHLLNVAVKYDYPELTKNAGNYTKGLYTEGRLQSPLSQRGSAKKYLEKLFKYCNENRINLALSFAYPQNSVRQPTDRYTVTIEDLVHMAKYAFGHNRIEVKQIDYKHANNRNSTAKYVIEYLILCGDKKTPKVYNIEALKKNLSELSPTNKNAMYNSHLYWSQKSYNICETLIKGLSEEGDIVFDPFLGSGVTVLESIKKGCNRIGIGCDVNEMPLFISKTLLSGCFEDNLKASIDDFIKKISKLENFYVTNCSVCGSKQIIKTTIFDKPVRNSNNITIKSINFVCEHCKAKYKTPDEEDYSRMCSEHSFKNVQNIHLLPNSKIAVGDNDSISDIFTQRNLIVLDEIISIINEYPQKTKDIFRYILMSILHLCKITDKHSNSQWPLWIPKLDCVEKNIVDVLTKKCIAFSKTINYVQNNYMEGSIVNRYNELINNKCLLLHKGSQYITNSDIPDNSVSLIITDPPYLEQVLYSEYMQLYKPFIDLNFNLEDEIVVSNASNRRKSKEDYFKLLETVFQICSNKLKPGGFMCLFFHDSNLNVWLRLINILKACGFEYVSQTHIKKSLTLKNIISPKKSLNGDAVLFFINTKSKISPPCATESIEEIEINLVKQVKHLIRNFKSLSTPELYDNGLMEMLIQNDWLEKLSEKYDSLVDIFEKHLTWDIESAKWKMAEN